jgi:hypothetical protein
LGLNRVAASFQAVLALESRGIHGFTPSFGSNARVALDHPPAAPSKDGELHR